MVFEVLSVCILCHCTKSQTKSVFLGAALAQPSADRLPSPCSRDKCSGDALKTASGAGTAGHPMAGGSAWGPGSLCPRESHPSLPARGAGGVETPWSHLPGAQFGQVLCVLGVLITLRLHTRILQISVRIFLFYFSPASPY